MTRTTRLATGRRYQLPSGDRVTAVPLLTPRAAPVDDCTWVLFGEMANYAVVADGSIRMTMVVGEEGVMRLAPQRGWSTGLRVSDLLPSY